MYQFTFKHCFCSLSRGLRAPQWSVEKDLRCPGSLVATKPFLTRGLGKQNYSTQKMTLQKGLFKFGNTDAGDP